MLNILHATKSGTPVVYFMLLCDKQLTTLLPVFIVRNCVSTALSVAHAKEPECAGERMK